MSLILPPFAFADCTDNLSGSTPPAGNAIGTSFTSGGSQHTDGTAVSVISALTHDVHYLVVSFGGVSGTATADTACLADILIDPAGGTSWTALINDLVIGFMPVLTGGQVGHQIYYYFPLWIPAGASLGVQSRCNVVSWQSRVCMWAYGNPSRPDMWWCGQGVESLGINAASSKGTDITPGSTTATFSWTNVGSPTSYRYGAIQFGQNGSDATATAIGYFAQIGVGGARLPGSPTFYWANDTSERSARTGCCNPIWCDIPAGTQMQVGACASGSAEVHDVALYGVY